MLRDRLLRSEFDPGSLFPPEVTQRHTESPLALSTEIQGQAETDDLDGTIWPHATVDSGFSTRLLELAELLFRLTEFLGLSAPLSRHQLATIVQQRGTERKS